MRLWPRFLAHPVCVVMMVSARADFFVCIVCVCHAIYMYLTWCRTKNVNNFVAEPTERRFDVLHSNTTSCNHVFLRGKCISGIVG